MATDPHKRTEPRLKGPAKTGNDELRLDPADVRRYARMLRERQRVGPLGKLLRYVAVVAVLAGAGAVYWNFDTLRGIRVDFPQIAALFSGRGPDSGPVRPGAEPETAVVEPSAVVGAAAPTSLPAPARETAAPDKPADKSASAAPAAEPVALAANEPPPLAGTAVPEPAPASAAAAEPPPPPPEPESFSFGGVTRVEVNEADASAAVLVVRSGDMRRPSSVRWWTTDGTAKAGQDYVDLGRQVLKFAPSEQNRGIHVPIVGDKTKEGPESFYVNIAWGESEEPAERIEVVIKDDD